MDLSDASGKRGATDRRSAPRDVALAALSTEVPPDTLAAFPTRWERLGDVVVLKVPEPLRPWGTRVGEALARALGCRAALDDAQGVAGEYREMAAPVLWHDGSVEEPAVTVHREHGVLYKLDASRLMFSSGNVEERARMGRVDARRIVGSEGPDGPSGPFRTKGETVVDLFAGIGYFALPLARSSGAARVVAVEKNPVAYRYLVENALLNRVEDVLEPVLGDNREVPLPRAQRVSLGYVGGTWRWLPRAFEIADAAGCTLHYHDTFGVDRWREEAEGQVRDAAASAGFSVDVTYARVVKSYAPAVVHAVVDARVRSA